MKYISLYEIILKKFRGRSAWADIGELDQTGNGQDPHSSHCANISLAKFPLCQRIVGKILKSIINFRRITYSKVNRTVLQKKTTSLISCLPPRATPPFQNLAVS